MNQNEQEQMISELESEIERLHALYNQYFMGIEKLEPTVVRKNLDRKINMLRKEQIKNTALRFRLQMQIQKYNTQSTYWSRVCRQIEEGTYSRQLSLAKKRVNARHQESKIKERISETDMLLSQIPLSEYDLGEGNGALNRQQIEQDAFNIDLDDPFADLQKELFPKSKISPQLPKSPNIPLTPSEPVLSKKSPPPIPKAAPPAPPPIRPISSPMQPSRAAEAKPPAPVQSSNLPSLSDEQAQSIYRRFLAARKKCNESTENISMESVKKSLNAKIKSETGVVDFKVVIKGGKAVIKTVKEDSKSD